MWFDNPPQIRRGLFFTRQKPLDLIMADFTIQQGGQPGRCGLPKGAYQIIAVQVQEFAVFHTPSLLKSA
jgi:hypothetical protein